MKMKTNKILKSLAVLMTGVVLLGGSNVMSVSAGLRINVKDASTVQESIDESVWHNPDGSVKADKGVIVFPDASTADTKLIVKKKVSKNEGVPEMATVSSNLKFKSLPQGEKFAIVFGLANIEGELGKTGNIEVVFTNEEGLKVSVIAYAEEGQEAVLIGTKKCGSLSGSDVKISLLAEQKIKVTVAGQVVCNAAMPISGEGRIGFLQTGSCGVEIKNINVTTYEYDRPENCDIDENFDKGEFNENLLTSKLIHTSVSDYETFLGIDEYEGNNAFYFTYPSLCYLGTKYSYSNFEMSFDVPYLQRKNEIDDDGNIVKKASSQIIVTFGGEAATFNDYGHETAAERLLFREISAITRKSGGTESIHSIFPFFDSAYDKGFSIKIRMVDNVVKIFMKWIDETKWIEVLSYEIETPTGTIQIWGQDACNYAIDNLKITSLDVNPSLIEVDYASSVIQRPEEYTYETMEKVYAPQVETEESFSWYWLIPIVAGVCLVGIGITAIAAKTNKRKGGDNDEK